MRSIRIFNKSKNNLLGIELFRGIACYAVIIVHSGDETWGIPISQTAIQFRLLFYFAVPFFLATSFYLMIRKPQINTNYKFWSSRIERILIPYIIWTIIFIFFKFILFLLTNQDEQINSIIKDPLSVVFLGASSYHLYFLPLLFTGNFLIFIAKYLKNKQIKIWKLILLSAISTTIYQLIVWSNNSFSPGSNIAFLNLMHLIIHLMHPNWITYSIIRLVFVVLFWIFRCLPYLLLAITLNRLLSIKTYFNFNNLLIAIVCFFCFLIVNILGDLIIPKAYWEIIAAYSLLFCALALSKQIKTNQLISNLGQCSFGIYLIHPLIKNGVEIAVIKKIPMLYTQVSIISILVYSGLTFLISWILVYILMKNKLIAKYMFGS